MLPVLVRQRGFAVLERLRPGSTNVGATLTLPATTTATDLADLAAVLVERHDALRMKVSGVAGVEVRDPGALDRGPVEEVADPADLVRRGTGLLYGGGPNLGLLWAGGPDGVEVRVEIPHFVTDAWSQGIVVRDLVELAGAGDLAPSAGFSGCVPAIAAREEVATRAPDLGYWQRQLDRPAQRPLPPERLDDGGAGIVTVRLPARPTPVEHSPFTAALERLAMAARALVGWEGLTVSVPVAGRWRRDQDDVVGLFTEVVSVHVAAHPELHPPDLGAAGALLRAQVRVQSPAEILVPTLGAEAGRLLGTPPGRPHVVARHNDVGTRSPGGRGAVGHHADGAVFGFGFDLLVDFVDDGTGATGGTLHLQHAAGLGGFARALAAEVGDPAPTAPQEEAP